MSGDCALLYQDDELLAVAKPAGQAVIPGRGLPEEPLHAVLERGLGRRLYVVHRIDREASGLVVFAKTPQAHRRLCGLFEGRALRKVYLAAVQGAVAQAGQVDAALREFGSGRTAIDKRGKPSLTRYRPAEALRAATLIEVTIVTGRRHQIRVHLYSIGHPVLGDPLYGQDRPVGAAPRLMLHHLELALPSGPTLRCPPAADFEAVLSSLR